MITVALIGRTNVGKSTLFNRIIGEAKAMTSELPNTTRDRNIGTTVWRGVTIRCIDTGGVEAMPPPSKRGVRRSASPTIEEEIVGQAQQAVGDADLLLLIVDAREGLLPGERAIARHLHALGKPIIIVWNKSETERLRTSAADGAALGFGMPSPTSAVTGSGVGDLLDRIVEHAPAPSLPEEHPATEPDDATTPVITPVTRIAIIGEPNVGKSSLLNAILGREEVIVLPEPFTTRDVHDVEIEVDGRAAVLLDTAGIRRLAYRATRSSRTKLESIERHAVQRSLRAVRHADVAVLVLDGTAPASKHTKQLADAVLDEGKACVIVVNKMDLLPPSPIPAGGSGRVTRRGGPPPRGDRNRARWGSEAAGPASATEHIELTDSVHRLFPHLSWAPIIPTSAERGTNVDRIVPTALRAGDAWRRTLVADELAAIHAAVKRKLPTPRTPLGKKKSAILEIQQSGTTPPAFILRSRKRIKLTRAIPSIVERVFRTTYDFAGTPIRVIVKSVKG